MQFQKSLTFSVLILALTLAACGQVKPTQEAMMEKPTEVMMEKPEDMATTEAPETTMEDSGAMMEKPEFFSVELTNVNTGTTFKLEEFEDKVILVETLAQWCSNCLRQQKQVLELHSQLGQRENFLSLGLDIDPNEDADALKDYVNRNGFTWLYAVVPVEVSREIANLYGDQFLNPPSTPMFIIDQKGEVHPLPFGIKSADDLMKAIEPFLAEAM